VSAAKKHVAYPAACAFDPKTGFRSYGAARVFGTPDRTFNDQMFAGPYEAVMPLQDVYATLHEFFARGIMINAETDIGWNLLDRGVRFEPVDFVTYNIRRRDAKKP
jgi:hypothetical protein